MKVNVRNRGEKNKPNWEYRFETAKVNGKRQSQSKCGFRTKAEALAAGTEALAQYNLSGSVFKPSEMSVSDFFDYWLQNYCHVNLSDNTTNGYEVVIRKYIKPKIGGYKLKAITTPTLQVFINEIATEHHFKQSYLNTIMKVLKNGFKYAEKQGKFIASNPAEDLILPSNGVPPKEDIIVLSLDDLKRIFERFRGNPHIYYPMQIAYNTGLRISEVYGLTWNDIDFENKSLSVNQIVKKFDYNSRREKGYHGIRGKAQTKWYLGSAKTESSYRTIRISDHLCEILKEYKEWQENNKKNYGEYYLYSYLKADFTQNRQPVDLIVQADSQVEVPKEYNKTDLVCVKENGEFHGTDSMKYPSKVINSELGIRFNFHAFRHTHATRLIEAGVQPKAVSQRLGHSTIRTTLDIYVKVTDKMEDDLLEAFSSYSVE